MLNGLEFIEAYQEQMKTVYEAMYNHHARDSTDKSYIPASRADQLLRNGFFGYVNVILAHLQLLPMDKQHYLANAIHMINNFIRREHYLEYSGTLPLKNSILILKQMRKQLRRIRRHLKRLTDTLQQ